MPERFGIGLQPGPAGIESDAGLFQGRDPTLLCGTQPRHHAGKRGREILQFVGIPEPVMPAITPATTLPARMMNPIFDQRDSTLTLAL